MLLTACSDDHEEPTVLLPDADPETGLTLGVAASAPRFVDETSHQDTRAWSWTPPTDYYAYDDLYAGIDEYESLTSKGIDVFFKGTDESLHGRLRYFSNSKVWKLVARDDNNQIIESMPTGNYYVYGFIPRDAADDATIAMLSESSTYADGAVLTIEGLQTVTADACVIIGAREGFRVATDEDNGTDYDGSYDDVNSNDTYDEGTDSRSDRIRPGDFCFGYNGGAEAKNYLFLLFDHLCSALEIQMRVDATYNALRHIKVKELYLEACTDDGTLTKKMNVTVELRANETGENPIQSVTFTPTGDELSGSNVFQSATGHLLTTDYTSFMGHFLPHHVTRLTLTSTYDVYDTNVTAEHHDGNLVRKDCKATNTMLFSDLLSDEQVTTRRGCRYTINMTIKPTYLYVLSEPDLDNPTVEIED